MSADGYVADRNNKTPWSDEEWDEFNIFQKSCNALLVGSKTYDVMKQHDELVDAQYYVASTDSSKSSEKATYINIESADDLPKVDVLGVTGGTKLNSFIMELGVVDEIILDIEPHIFGGGTPLFHKLLNSCELSLISTKKLNDNTIQLHYKVQQ